MSDGNHTSIMLSDEKQGKAILWEKYLAKKKSFGKAQFRVDEFRHLDEHAFEQWLGTFAGSRMAEAFILKHEYRKRAGFQSDFQELCRMRKTQPGEMIYQVQKLCIEQNRFFWGVVHNLYEQALEDMRNRYRQALKDFLSTADAGRDADPETVKTLLDSFLGFCHTGEMEQERKEDAENPARAIEIKKLYRTLCLKHHPDKTGFYNESLWLEIQSAYEHDNLKKLRELLKAPVMKNIAMAMGLTCEEIRAMIRELELRFKPVRAELKKARHSMCWDFRSWNDEKKVRAKESLIHGMDKEISAVKQRLQELRDEIFTAIRGESVTTRRKRKNVRIEIEADMSSREYKIHLSYFRHTKDLVETAPAGTDEPPFIEMCVVAALNALKVPCRVTLVAPRQIAEHYRDVEFAAVFGGDIPNLFARHIVVVENAADGLSSSESTEERPEDPASGTIR